MPVQGDPNYVHGVATNVVEDGKVTMVVYHSTPVVKFTESKIILNTGGWNTQTTKNRMNQASNQFGLGYQVRIKNGTWVVEYGDLKIPFEDDVLELRR
jgi:hypothetical protein